MKIRRLEKSWEAYRPLGSGCQYNTSMIYIGTFFGDHAPMKKPYAIDIDDVLGSLSQLLNPALNKRFNRAIPLSGWHTFNITSLYDISLEQFLDVIVEQSLLSAIAPYPGVKEALRRVRAAGHAVVLITSRGYHPGAYEITQAWLNKHDLYFDHLIVVPEGLSKAQAAIGAYPDGFELMADDYPPNLDKMKEAGLVKTILLIDQPWNQDREDLVLGKNRFRSLVDALSHHMSRQIENEPQLA